MESVSETEVVSKLIDELDLASKNVGLIDPGISEGRYPDDKASKTWEFDALGEQATGYLLKVDLNTDIMDGWYCGYVRFKKNPLSKPGYNGAATYVPVHGGITFFNDKYDDGSVVFGFDCAHAGDSDKEELKDEEFLTKTVENMAVAIKMLSGTDVAYNILHSIDSAISAIFPKARFVNKFMVKLIDSYHSKVEAAGAGEFDITDNFGAMIHVLGGKV